MAFLVGLLVFLVVHQILLYAKIYDMSEELHELKNLNEKMAAVLVTLGGAVAYEVENGTKRK